MTSFSKISQDAAMPLPRRADLAELPWSDDMAKQRGLFGFDSTDPRSRSFNLIRAKLFNLRREKGWNCFGVVSATPNVGKSYLACNVAAALSRNPRHQTTLVDFDLRRGSSSYNFGADAIEDAALYLAGDERVSSPPAFGIEGQALVLIPTLPGIAQSAEYLSGSRAQEMLDAMQADKNNMYIIDLPPVFANDDVSIVMGKLDAYILVAEEGKSSQREVKDVVAMLGKEKMAGVILNKYQGGMMSEGYGFEDYYAKGYGYQYGYGSAKK